MRIITRFRSLLAATAALALSTVGFPPAVEAQAPKSPQAIFNEAQASFEAGRWKEASDLFDRALQTPKLGRAAAAIRARRASALFHLFDRALAREEAEKSIAAFEALGVAKSEDLALAYLTLGDMARGDLDGSRAVAMYGKALAVTEGSEEATHKRWARVGTGYAALTSDPALVANLIDQQLADDDAAQIPVDNERGNLLALRALAELNRGDARKAAGFIEKALDIVGRETTKVGLTQIRVRSDAALIYARLGDEERARKFFAYSGAGRLKEGANLVPADVDLPVCGDDISPKDVAVIEFAIGADGHAAGAVPVYASRTGTMGATFAESVVHWRWQPETLAKLDLFWRAAVRMELRCVKRPPAIDIADAFRISTEAWLAGKGVTVALDDPTARPIAAGDGARMAAIANDLLALKGRDEEAAAAAAQTLPDRLAKASAPADVMAYAAYKAIRPRTSGSRSSYYAAVATRFAPIVATFEARPDAGRATAWLRTEYALALESSGAIGKAPPILRAVVETSPAILPADDPVRSVATLHLAMLDKRAGDAAGAEARLAAAGMDAEQCSLLNVRPVARNTSLSSGIFPAAALRWGFEGYVREAFDIAADGHVEDVRTIVAYPPFIFGPATEKAMTGFRYLPPTLGDQAVGCVGQTHGVRFSIPSG